MAITKKRKNEIIQEVKDKLEQQKSMIFVDFSGLDTSQILDLREQLKKAGCQMKIIKKNLFRVTLQKVGNPLWQEIKKIPGQLAVIFGFEQENKSPKITYRFSQENKNLQILGGYLDGEYKTTEGMIMIAQLPSRKEVLASLTGTVFAPVSNLTHVLNENIKGLVCILSKIKK